MGIREGILAATPIAAAYLPVAFELGAASSKLGFSIFESALWSAVMFSGANQALLLSGISSDTALIMLVFLAITASLRHILYGVALWGQLDTSILGRSVFVYGLTDEVFAITLSTCKNRNSLLSSRWLVELALSALSIWVIGTALRNAVGNILLSNVSNIRKALDFALPALFISLVWSTAKWSILGRMFLSAALSALTIITGYPEFAILVGALPAFIPGGQNK